MPTSSRGLDVEQSVAAKKKHCWGCILRLAQPQWVVREGSTPVPKRKKRVKNWVRKGKPKEFRPSCFSVGFLPEACSAGSDHEATGR
jgi:hypothetical protein